MARSVNLVILVGNLTRDPQMRYTPNGAAVTNFSIATNRSWTDAAGVPQEQVDYHNIVTWGKLAETCNNSLAKGRKVYVRGRLSNRSWDGADGQKHYRTEVVADEVVFLDPPREKEASVAGTAVANADATPKAAGVKDEEPVSETPAEEDINTNDLPF